MARELFVNPNLNLKLKDKVRESASLSLSAFKKVLSNFILSEAKKEILSLKLSQLNETLYYIGSFARHEPSLLSDVDFLLVGDFQSEDLNLINEGLRKVFRKHSLKVCKNIEEVVSSSDSKTLLSCWHILPVLKALDVLPTLREKIRTQGHKTKIRSLIFNENHDRRSRYGKRPGRLRFHIKNSPGGVIDSYQLQFLNGEIQDSTFLYKLRLLNQLYTGTDSLSLTHEQEFAQHFKDLEGGFYTYLHLKLETTFLNLKAQNGEVTDRSFSRVFKEAGFTLTAVEVGQAQYYLDQNRGVLSSPSYHVYTVYEHLHVCLSYCLDFIKLYNEKLRLSSHEKLSLLWAAVFHDVMKCQKDVPHSEAGALFAQDFGAKVGWSEVLVRDVSWLIREHLSLARHSFNTDPFDEKLLQRLSTRGCQGRRAVMLFVLTCADIKATNPQSWSNWKKEILEKVLDNILGVETKAKEVLQSMCSSKMENVQIAEALSVKEISFIPEKILMEDLKSDLETGFAFYTHADKIWVRYYAGSDEEGLALKILHNLTGMGVYIHHAFFKTLKETKQVYNWFCVETGVSPFAFQKRFLALYKTSEKEEVDFALESEYRFKKIKITRINDTYAIVSFRGADEKGALTSAVSLIKSANLNILWGHAVTWGEEIEDVFGVRLSVDSDLQVLSSPDLLR